MKFDERVLDVVALVPGLIRSALVLLPEGLLIGGTGAERAFDHEPLVRAALACVGTPARPLVVDPPTPSFVECTFVSENEIVVIQRGRKDPRLAFAAVCTRERNLALVLSATREALHVLEGAIVVDDLEP